jgi:hypothetical protein
VLAYRHGSEVLVAASLLAALVGLVMLRRRPDPVAAAEPAAAEPVETAAPPAGVQSTAV